MVCQGLVSLDGIHVQGGMPGYKGIGGPGRDGVWRSYVDYDTSGQNMAMYLMKP